MTKSERLNGLYKEYGLTKEDIYTHKHYTIITRSGIEKIETKTGIEVTYEVQAMDKDFVSIKAIGVLGNRRMETFGSAIKGGSYSEGSTNTWYVSEMAEKRALSRIVLKMSGLYQLGDVYGQDEAETFNVNKSERKPLVVDTL